MKDENALAGFERLMDIACPGWGFCGCMKRGEPLHVTDFIPSYGPVTADQFVEWLFLADDMNPNSDPEKWAGHKAALREAFVSCMGAEVVDATKLWWSDCPVEPTSTDEKFHGPLS